MIIFLYGTDLYRRGMKFKSIIDAYRAKHSEAHIVELDGEEKDSFEKLPEALRASSLFDASKLIIVRNFFPIGRDRERGVLALIREIVDSKNIALLIVSDDDAPKAFSFLHEPPTFSEGFLPLVNTQLETFIKKEAAAQNVPLTPQLLRALASSFAGDSWGLTTELAKLALGASFIQKTETLEPFVAVRALQLGGATKLPLLERLLATEDAAYLFNLLAYQSNGNMRATLADDDVLIKSGRLEYEMALTKAVLNSR